MAEQAVYRVEGLDCGDEVAVLKKALGHSPGIVQLDFDVVNARMAVTYEPDRTSSEELIRVVKSTGMKAIPWEQRSEDKTVSFWQRRGRLVMTAASAVLLLAALLSHWLLHGGLLDAFSAGESESHVLPMISIVLYLAATVAGAWYVVPMAFSAVRQLQPDMNLLMTVAVIGAIVIGEWFEGATVAFLFALALLLEHWSAGRARRAIGALLDLSPKTARYRDPESGEIREVPVEQVPVGVMVFVRPGEKIPLDGTVTAGRSTVNQAPITGESMPVEKEAGEEVYAGTINEAGALEVKATKPANDTTLSRILHMVEEAQSRRAPAQQWVDRFAYYYTPAMMILAAAIAFVPPLVFSASWTDWFYRGLVILVIACPCALVISTPVSIVSALTAAARNGVLIKGGAYIEAAGRLKAIALDKTGTLT